MVNVIENASSSKCFFGKVLLRGVHDTLRNKVMMKESDGDSSILAARLLLKDLMSEAR